MQIEEFNLLVERMKDKMYRLALRILKSEEDAMDALQDSFIKVWNKREKLAEIENPDAYCMTIMRNMSIDKIRSRKMSTSDIDNHFDIKSGAVAPDKKLELKQQVSSVMQVVNDLPENHRTVIHLRDIDGYTYKEISEITGYSIEKVKVYLHRARTKLRQKLQKLK